MDSDLRREVRALIQEEMRSPIPPDTRSKNAATLLINQTRAVLNQSASSCAAGMERAVPSNTPNPWDAPPNPWAPPQARQNKFHPNRFSYGKSKKAKVDETSKKFTVEVQLLRRYEPTELDAVEDVDLVPEYVLHEEMIVVKQALVLLHSNMKEVDIKKAIIDSCKRTLPLMNERDIEFVKRDRSKICSPAVEKNFKWNFDQVKKLFGQGKLYVRLLTDVDELKLASRVEDHEECSTAPEELPSSCSSSTVCDDETTTLLDIFPNVPTDRIRSVVEGSSSLERAASELANISEKANTVRSTDVEVLVTKEGLSSLLHHKLLEEKKRLLVDEDYLIEEALSYYKNIDYNPKIPLKISFKNQAAVDAGGPLRQFFSSIFDQLTEPTSIYVLFEGSPYRLVPVHNSETCLSEIFVYVGKIIAHSVCQGGPGFSYFSSSVFTYLRTGSIQMAACEVELEDVPHLGYKSYISQLLKADEASIEVLAKDDCLINFMTQSGECSVLNLKTKDRIAQSMIVHNVLVSRKASLDQLRTGLGDLDFLNVVAMYPHLSRYLFVHEQNTLSSDMVLSKIKFKDPLNPHNEILKSVIKSFDEDLLRKFCAFITGMPNLDALAGTRKITVKFVEASAIYASTCTFDLTIPSQVLSSVELLGGSLTAVIGKWKNNFNSL